MNRKKTLSNLPLLRFTSVISVLVALDSLACISLWIAGGNSRYLETNVEQFSITRSTFDLACIAALRGIIIIASQLLPGTVYYNEEYSNFFAETSSEHTFFFAVSGNHYYHVIGIFHIFGCKRELSCEDDCEEREYRNAHNLQDSLHCSSWPFLFLK